MGKCISKDQQLKIREIDERSYIAITDEFEYYNYEDENAADYYYDWNDEGQSESKKSSSSSKKKMQGPETKGTSISFGFKKKNYNTTTANKKLNIVNNNNNLNRDKEQAQEKSTIISNLNVISAEQNNFIITEEDNNDDNGNNTSSVTTSTTTANNNNNGDKDFVLRTTSPAKLQPAKRDQLIVGRSNRFGFRQNVIRPTSGITPKFNEYDNVNNNNNNNSNSNHNDIDKQQRRIKSASSSTTRSNSNFGHIPSKLEQKPINSMLEQQQQHQHEAAAVKQQNEMNANTISSRPTSSASQNQNQAVILSKYTLHSTSLPRPQYPVSVSVSAVPCYSTLSYNRNTTPATTSLSSSITNRPPMHYSVQSKLIDTKGAKHQANLNKRGGMMTRRDESLDSGIASHDSTSENHHHQQSQQQQQQSEMDTSFTRRSRRRFEMVPGSSRHKFEIRDLNDYNENAVIVPLSLPKLPTDRNEIVTNGLIRSTNSFSTDNEMDMSISEGSRPTSFISTASEAESFEEEKLKIDTSCSEKSLKGAIMKLSNKNSSSGSSSKTSSPWKNIGVESMATNEFSSISVSSSSDEDKINRNKSINAESHIGQKKDIDCDEDELSSMTITADHSSYLNSTTISKASQSKGQKETVNDAFIKQQQNQQPKMASISRKELFIQVDEVKFAETVAAAKNLDLLDDETSPSDSLVSSSESGDAPIKKFVKSDSKESRQIDEIKEEEDLEDITPELISPGTPTHASNSLSFSDGGRDFLIDDEIADQPALMISNKKQKGSESHHHDEYKSTSMALNITSDCTTSTPTLKDVSMNLHDSLRSLNKLHALKTIKSDQSSPAMNRKAIMERSGSLDTLSPCDSIASDDLMADFDLASSLDSIDRPSIDDFRNYSETDTKYNSDMMKEYGAIFKSSHQSVQRRHSSRENITSQLPARATRLLNRRLQNNSSSSSNHNNNHNNSSPINNGSESPRSLDSMHSRNSSARASIREHLKQRQQQNLQSQLMNFNSSSEDLLADKSLRNSMLQDVATFKKQLVQLRRTLQEDEDKLMMSDTLNPFEVNGQIFASNLNGSNGIACEKEMPCSDKEKIDDEKNVVLTNEQLELLEDQRRELADLRRQVVFLQSQLDDKDRMIRQQQSKLNEMENDKFKLLDAKSSAHDCKSHAIETTNCATQTDRLRPMSMGHDFTSQQEESTEPHKSTTSDDSKSKQIPTITVKSSSSPRSKTQISSVYTKLSSIKPTSSSATNNNSNNNKSSSIPTSPSSKPMKSTKIEHPKVSPMRMQSSANVMRNMEGKSPLRRSIPQLVKSPNGVAKNSPKSSQKQAAAVSSSIKSRHRDDSNGNSATSSLSTSSSNSSLNNNNNNASNHNNSNSIGFLANQLNEIYSRGIFE